MNKDLNRLRNMLGMLGIFLPVISALFNLIFGTAFNPPGVLTSISATHYSAAYILFEGVVFAVGLFLLCYRGYDITDRAACICAGIGAITLTLFPCKLEGAENRNFIMAPQEITNIVHLCGAAAFFISLFFVIAFQFTKTSEKPLQKKTAKWRRNILYTICGWIMLLALIAGFSLSGILRYSVYIGEWIALWAFGLAWLTKGGIILRDDMADLQGLA